jgi:phosphoribosylformylglycinamidine synthase
LSNLVAPLDLSSAEFLNFSAEQLTVFSRQRLLSLTVEEMTVIQTYFRRQHRPPTDAELETLAQTWSEHCKHKTFRARVSHTETDAEGHETRRDYADLLKDTIVKVTEDLDKPWCLSVFKDNAGIVAVDGEEALAFKAETHNHPSALEPYGGAGTGLGGVIRDVLGAGLGAKPIANTDVFCFGPLEDGVKTSTGLTTRRIVHGVVSGVRDYGNRMGIPTVAGAVYFDEDFRDNPLVFCGTLGLIPVNAIAKEVRPGDRVVVAGGRVGRDGIHGATFSSDALTTGLPSSVVQIGNPIVQKKMMDVLLQARDKRLYRGITDCGAGGLSSAVGEMGEKTGVRVDLEKAPLKYEGLEPWEIWLSESQERMVLAVPPENVKALLDLFASEDVEAADIGVFGNDGRLTVAHRGQVIVDMEMAFLHDGLPKRHMTSCWSPPPTEDFPLPGKTSLEKALLGILAQPTVASKEWIIRQYDHEVQGRTVMKPLVGPRGVGPGDAAVLQLDPRRSRGAAVAMGLNPHMGRWDPYAMAASVIDEAVRNLVAVGARPDRISLLDNFCGGNPQDPRLLGELVRAAQACHDVARVYGAPFISGKDSLYNQFADHATGRKRDIPTTLLISALAVVDDVGELVSMDFKKPGNLIYLIGETKDELGGSRYGIWRNTRGGRAPSLDPVSAFASYGKLHRAMAAGSVASCHDCSDGGLGAALAEMALASGLGFDVDLRRVPVSAELAGQKRDDKILFSESNARFVVEVPVAKARAFETVLRGVPLGRLGRVAAGPRAKVKGFGPKVLSWRVADLERSWRGGFRP